MRSRSAADAAHSRTTIPLSRALTDRDSATTVSRAAEPRPTGVRCSAGACAGCRRGRTAGAALAGAVTCAAPPDGAVRHPVPLSDICRLRRARVRRQRASAGTAVRRCRRRRSRGRALAVADARTAVGAAARGCRDGRCAPGRWSKPVPITVTRTSSDMLSSITAPKMMLAFASASFWMISAASLTSNRPRSLPPVMFSRMPVAPSTDSSSSGEEIAARGGVGGSGSRRWRCRCPSAPSRRPA